MKARMARLGVLLIATLGLLAGATPSAEAEAVGALVVVGEADVAQGLSYPCVGNSAPDLTKCPDEPGVATGQGVYLPTKNKLAHPWLDNGKTVGVTFTGQAAGALAKVNKAKCGPAGSPCVSAGLYNLSLGGVVHGSCGLSWGKLSGSVQVATELGNKPPAARNASVNFVGVGGTLVVTGHVDNSYLVGAVLAVPDLTQGGSCLNQNAKPFLVAGAVAVLPN